MCLKTSILLEQCEQVAVLLVTMVDHSFVFISNCSSQVFITAFSFRCLQHYYYYYYFCHLFSFVDIIDKVLKMFLFFQFGKLVFHVAPDEDKCPIQM